MHFLVYYIPLIFLYMFRAILCSSSGGSIVNTQHLVLYVSLFLCDRSVHRQLEAPSTKKTWRDSVPIVYTVDPPDDEHNMARNM